MQIFKDLQRSYKDFHQGEVIALLLDDLVDLISYLGTSKASLSMKTTKLFTAL